MLRETAEVLKKPCMKLQPLSWVQREERNKTMKLTNEQKRSLVLNTFSITSGISLTAIFCFLVFVAEAPAWFLIAATLLTFWFFVVLFWKLYKWVSFEFLENEEVFWQCYDCDTWFTRSFDEFVASSMQECPSCGRTENVQWEKINAKNIG